MNMFANFNELQLTTANNALNQHVRSLRQQIADNSRTLGASQKTEILQRQVELQIELKTAKELMVEIGDLITLRRQAATSQS